MPALYACILAGGSGERFWPMSRSRTPKHLLRLFSDRTLIEEAAARLKGVVPDSNVFVLTSEDQAPAIRAVLPHLRPEQVVAEPARRDTGPAAALATALARASDPEAVVGLVPADAYIQNGRRYSEQLSAAFALAGGGGQAGAGRLFTIGIPPTYAATGFGYLELGEDLGPSSGGGSYRRVKRYVEKPDAGTAERYFESGAFSWNASIFVWRVGAFLAEAERNAPALASFIRGFPKGDFAAYLAQEYPKLPKISVDYAIMEKAADVATLEAEFDWDDVGTWTALPRHLPADGAGNVVRGSATLVDSSGNIVMGGGRTVALLGVKDLIVVETPDAVLVCHRSAAEQLKKLQAQLPKSVL